MKNRLKKVVLGDRDRIAGTVYGTIIVMSVLAGGARPYQHHLWRLVVISIVGAAVVPLCAVALGVAGVFPSAGAVRLALWIGVLALTVQGSATRGSNGWGRRRPRAPSASTSPSASAWRRSRCSSRTEAGPGPDRARPPGREVGPCLRRAFAGFV
jgi:hypothetical protein